jgi:hypothetical protein
MWILFASLLVVAAIGLLLIKLNSVAKSGGPVWKTVEPVRPSDSRQAVTEIILPLNAPASATQPEAMPEKALAARHS